MRQIIKSAVFLIILFQSFSCTDFIAGIDLHRGWLDGSYAKYQIQDIIRSYRNNEPEKILTPDELLFNTGIADEIYYPNSGVFTAFLVRTYGIEKVNRLFTLIPSSFKKHFEQTCSDSWQNMSEKFSDYVDSL